MILGSGLRLNDVFGLRTALGTIPSAGLPSLLRALPLLVLYLPAMGHAYADELPDTIIITADRSPTARSQTAAALSVVDDAALRDARMTVGLDEALGRVPGLLVQSSGNFAQDTRLQIRGFGTRAAFGIREIRVLVDGLPETLADGQTQLDGVDLGTIARVEVLRSPAAGLYGNAAGGAVQLFTDEGPDTPWAEIRGQAGAYGFRKWQLRGGGRHDRWKVVAHASRTEGDGYRQHAATRFSIGNLRVRYDVDEKIAATLLVDVVDAPLARDPGALTRAQADADPTVARDRNVALDAGESVRQGRLGFVARADGLEVYGYILSRDFENRLPIAPPLGAGVVAFDRLAAGAGTRYVTEHQIAGRRHRMQIGLELQHQDDDRRRYDNLQGDRGPLRLAQREQVAALGAYARYTLYWTEHLGTFAGARYDVVRYDTDVHFDRTGATGGTRSLDAWSPALGTFLILHDRVSLFAALGSAFQTPTTTELGSPTGGGLDAGLEPQESYTIEAGARGGIGLVAWLATVFGSRIEDELIRFESPSGRDGFRNAGRSRRFGLELDWQAFLSDELRWSGAVTWMDARFREYQTDAGDFRGNEEPGIPAWQLFQELRYDHGSGLFAAADGQFVDGFFVDDGNTRHSRSHELLRLRAGWTVQHGDWEFVPFVGIDNLLNQNYDGTVRLNALGGRHFEPAPGIAAFGGATLRVRL